MAQRTRLYKLTSIILLTFAAVFLFLAQSAYWINHTIFNQGNFSSITTTTILAEPNRDAISKSIVDNALADRPVIKRVIGQRAEALISGILGSDLSNQVISTLVDKAYAYTTTSNRKDIVVDLTPIKAPVAAVIAVADKTGRDIPQTNFSIPDEIVLLSKNAFPDLSGYVRLMLWLGPLLWLGTLLCLGTYIYIGRRDYATKVYKVGLTVIGVAVFGLVTMPFIPPPISAAVPDIGLRVVADSLVTNFLSPFSTQMWYMLCFTLVVLLIFNQRFNILRFSRSMLDKMSSLGTSIPNKKPAKLETKAKPGPRTKSKTGPKVKLRK